MEKETKQFIEEKIEGLAHMIVTTMASKEDLAKLETRFDTLETKVDTLETRMDTLSVATEQGFQEMNVRLGRIESQQLERIESLESDVIDLKSDTRRVKDHVGMPD